MATAHNEEVTHRIQGGTIFAQADAESVVDAIVALSIKNPEWKIQKTGTNTFRCNAALSNHIPSLAQEYHCRFNFYDWQFGMQAISVHPVLFKFL